MTPLQACPMACRVVTHSIHVPRIWLQGGRLASPPGAFLNFICCLYFLRREETVETEEEAVEEGAGV